MRYLLKKNIRLKNKSSNDECYILLTGPVVNSLNLIKLRDKITFICNHFYRHPDISKMNPSYYSTIENAHKTMSCPDKSEHSTEMIKRVKEKCPHVTLLLHCTVKYYLRLNKNNDSYFFAPHNKKIEKSLDIDFTKKSAYMKGTVYFLISLAIYMGFKKIYLIGAGYTLQPYQWLHFYEDQSQLRLNEKQENQMPEQEHLIMDQIAREKGVHIINVVPEGYKSPIYDSISVNEFNKMIEEN